MEYKKVERKINNIVNDNVKMLAQLFPSAVKDGEVDFEALKEELGEFQEVGSEKYELTWAGKQNAKKVAQEDVYGKTLKFIPEDSLYPETTENLYIEGDNLEVLKLLRQNYYGAIKMIYIDPPYNTGNDFVYNDNFNVDFIKSDIAEGNIGVDGEKYTINLKSKNRYHAKWLSMMYSRLKIAKDLMTDDGVIFISIDENEVDNIKKLGNEIFGEENYAGEIVWKNSSKNDQAYISMQHEYIICFVKNKDINKGDWSEKKEGLDEIYKAFDEFHKSLGDNWEAIHQEALKWYKQFPESNPIYSSKHYSWMDKNGVYFPSDISGPNFGQYRYDVIHPITGNICKEPNSGWRFPEETMKQKIADGLIHFGKDESTVPNNKTYLKDTENQSLTSIKYKDGRVASKNLAVMLGDNYFTNPKDVEILKRLIKAVGVSSGDIVLDFFSGSGATAEAVMSCNVDNNIGIKYIMVQLPEKLDETKEQVDSKTKKTIERCIDFLDTINKPHFLSEIGKERIRRAGNSLGKPNLQLNLDLGFKNFIVTSTNIKWNSIELSGQIDISRVTYKPDLQDFFPDAKDVDIAYELMLRQKDVPLSSTLELLNDIGKRTYLYASSYLICLESQITKELIDKLSELNPLPIKFIFRDSAFGDDIALKDETFRRLKALIEKNAGSSKITYTVEFI